ncbi:hypothetical protein [Streptomyces sp. YIM S03343]
MARAAEFLALSQPLTAEPALDPAIADAYRARLTGAFPTDLLRLLDAYVQADGPSGPTPSQPATAPHTPVPTSSTHRDPTPGSAAWPGQPVVSPP